MYEDEIEALSEILYGYVSRRKPDAPEDARKGAARFVAAVLVLAASWGAGDALAGHLLRKAGRRAAERLHAILSALGVRGLPKPGEPDVYCWKVMESADFGDEEVNEAVRELRRMGLSGGSYRPSFLARR